MNAKRKVLRCFQIVRIEYVPEEHRDKERLFQRAGTQQLKACDPVAVLPLGDFSSDPSLD